MLSVTVNNRISSWFPAFPEYDSKYSNTNCLIVFSGPYSLKVRVQPLELASFQTHRLGPGRVNLCGSHLLNDVLVMRRLAPAPWSVMTSCHTHYIPSLGVSRGRMASLKFPVWSQAQEPDRLSLSQASAPPKLQNQTVDLQRSCPKVGGGHNNGGLF